MEFKIVKKNDEYQIVWGEVYTPFEVDTDGETISDEDLRKAAWEFIGNGKVDKIDIGHSFVESGCRVVESFIARKGDPDFKEGAWVLGVWCPDEVWELVKKGELNGFSLAASVEKSPRRVLVEVAKQVVGETEKNSEPDIIPEHTHTFVVNFDKDGNIVYGKTDVVFDHFHEIKRGTVTESSAGHNHRFSVR